MEDRNSTGARSSEDIRAEIDRTRADMHNTVDQLEARLSPGQILDELWGRMRQGGAGGAGDLMRDHPVPLALMGLGVAMLAVEHSKSKHGQHEAHGYVGSTDRAVGRKGPYLGDDIDDVKFQDRATGIGSVSDTGPSSSDNAGGGGLKDKAGDTARRAMGGVDRVIHDQPLIAGAITFGLGLAAGLAMPATRFEDEKLGATSDHFKGSAKEKASDAGEKALEVVAQAAGSVKEAASEIRDAINDPELKDALAAKARAVVDVAKTAATETVDLAAGAVSRGSDESSSGESSRTAEPGSMS